MTAEHRIAGREARDHDHDACGRAVMVSATPGSPGTVGGGLRRCSPRPRVSGQSCWSVAWTRLRVAAVFWLPLRRVRPDRRFPLRTTVGADLGVLVASIRARGVVQPIVVEPDGDGYVIREGHRRVAAAVLAGLPGDPGARAGSATESAGLAVAAGRQSPRLFGCWAAPTGVA